ncbi:MAG: hypothetical protein JSW52_05275 [Candidatus Coatesbacteria bacterium]|nr:MAG: hypothetical protein JSW52_05275 [Candidatus Coatesbacteria bacterium]
MSKRSIIVAILLTMSVNAGAATLPWIEKYLFPIGCWPSIYHTGDARLYYDYDTGSGNIDEWDPPDYSPMADLRLDYARLRISRRGNAESIPYIPFDVNDNGIPDNNEADFEAIEAFSEIGIRPYLVIYKLWFWTMHAPDPYYTIDCDSGTCGGQEPDPPLPNPCNQSDYEAIIACYEDELISDYENHDPPFPNVFNLYRGLPIAQLDLDDEPFQYDFLRSKAMIDFYAENDPDMIPMNHIHDRTETEPIDGIDNFYSWAVCHMGEKVLCGRTYHIRRGNLANSPQMYNGWEWYDSGTGVYIPYGIPALERRLLRARECSLEYDVPFWFLPSAETYNGGAPNAHRSKSPREVRAPVNMALTYGARGLIYYGLYNHQGYDLMDNYGNFWADDYTLLAYDPGNPGVPIEYTIPSQDLYDEILHLNMKLHHVRNTLQTLTSLDAFHSFHLDNELPRGLIYDYVGNRTGRQWYSPKYTEETDFLDFGTFVCPYTGVRYFAVSDRFCNWPPYPDPEHMEDPYFPDPTERDVATVRHPGPLAFN